VRGFHAPGDAQKGTAMTTMSAIRKWIKKPKQRKAPWTTMRSQQRHLTPTKPRQRVRHTSKRRQATTAEYRREARAFVAAARARGDVCPAVVTVPELRLGWRYGHPISARLNEVHHLRGRANSLLLDKRYWLAVSKIGHRWIHEHMDEARERGWLCAKGDWGRP
jgi:hypothetical protein